MADCPSIPAVKNYNDKVSCAPQKWMLVEKPIDLRNLKKIAAFSMINHIYARLREILRATDCADSFAPVENSCSSCVRSSPRKPYLLPLENHLHSSRMY